jgi:hypothetical protein
MPDKRLNPSPSRDILEYIHCVKLDRLSKITVGLFLQQAITNSALREKLLDIERRISALEKQILNYRDTSVSNQGTISSAPSRRIKKRSFFGWKFFE